VNNEGEIKMREIQNWQETTQIWNRIEKIITGKLPDADEHVMVYDADLDDVFFATVEINEDSADQTTWTDTATDEQLPNPTWWAHAAFPEDI
jgi:multidrug efflux pump subunit AcrB